MKCILSALATTALWTTVSATSSTISHVRTSYPQVVTVQTSRQVASSYESYFDILKGNSRRLTKDNNKDDKDMVHLSVMLHGKEQAQVLEELQQEGMLTYEKDYGLTHRHLQGIAPNLTCYRTIDSTFETLDTWATEYPDLVTVKDIGESWKKTQNATEGYPLKVIVISAPSDVEKVDMMILGGHHSRELPPPETLMRWIQVLLENYGVNADITWILDRTNIHVVPISNPDGRAYVQDHLAWYYRKNAHPYGCEDGISRDGVDLNRNWPMFWGEDIGSSNNTCASSFRGGGPLSEPETVALYDYFKSIFPEQVSKGSVDDAMTKMEEMCPIDTPGLFIDVHSAGDFIYFPWGIEDKRSPNHLPLLTMSAKLAKPGNYTLWGPEQDGFIYFVSGDATDTTYGINCIASFGYEIGTEFYEPCDLYENNTLPVVHESLMYAAKTVSAPYKIPLGPDVLSIETDTDGMTTLNLTVDVSDVEMIIGHAIFPSEEDRSQAIQAVRVYVDTHPYDGGSAIAMTAVDGAFDSVREMAFVEIDMSEWSTGRHIVFVEGVDADGNAGAVSAVFVEKMEDESTDPSSAMNVVVSMSLFLTLLLAVAGLFM